MLNSAEIQKKANSVQKAQDWSCSSPEIRPVHQSQTILNKSKSRSVARTIRTDEREVCQIGF